MNLVKCSKTGLLVIFVNNSVSENGCSATRLRASAGLKSSGRLRTPRKPTTNKQRKKQKQPKTIKTIKTNNNISFLHCFFCFLFVYCFLFLFSFACSLTEVSDLIGFSFSNQRGEYTETDTKRDRTSWPSGPRSRSPLFKTPQK